MIIKQYITFCFSRFFIIKRRSDNMGLYGSKGLQQEIATIVKQELKNKKLNINTVIEDLDTAVTDAIENADSVTFGKLKNSAFNFLNAYQTFKNQKHVSTFAKMKQGLFLSDLMTSAKKEVKQSQLKLVKIRAIYKAAINFDIVLNAFLEGLQKEILYVHMDNNGNRLIYKIDYRDLPKFITASKKISSLSAATLEREKQLFEKQSVENMRTIDQILKPLELAMKFTTVETKKGQQIKQGQVIQLNSGKFFRVHNTGDLNEAYANLAMSKKEILSLDDFFENYLSEVDATPAILEEDISTGLRQYGVKSKGASAPALDQYLKVAKEIVINKNKQGYSKEELKEKMTTMFTTDGKRNKWVEESVGKKIVDVIMQ